MRTDFYYDSYGAGKIHGCRWTPDGEIRAVFQIVHGIAERVERYDEFAEYLNARGILVVAEDHMGHGKSVDHGGTKGFFDGGWGAVVRDCLTLTKTTMAEFPQVPYILFGHSMGSFLVRTILIKCPNLGISGAVLCGTGWQPTAVVEAGAMTAQVVAAKIGERVPSEKLQNIVFGGYNKRVEHPRTEFDWLSRDCRVVDEYIADPMCGFVASSGLLRDMLGGIAYVQKKDHLRNMKRDLPIMFVSGGDDPVGSYGAGVKRAADCFREVGMQDVRMKLFPLCRHEILNEINREEIFDSIYDWIVEKTMKNAEK